MRKSFFATTLIAALASLASDHTCQAVDLEEFYQPNMLAQTLASASAQPLRKGENAEPENPESSAVQEMGNMFDAVYDERNKGEAV